jgi:hypothetical protein
VGVVGSKDNAPSVGKVVKYVTSRDGGKDKGKYFTWNESHRRFMVREGEKDVYGVTQYDFLKNAPECEGSPNGNYLPDGTQIGVMYREMNEAKDAEVALNGVRFSNTGRSGISNWNLPSG